MVRRVRLCTVTFGGRSDDLGIAAGGDVRPESFQDEVWARSSPAPDLYGRRRSSKVRRSLGSETFRN